MYLIPIGHVFDTNRACIKKDLFVVLVNEKKKRERKEEKKGDQDRISPYNYQMNTISSRQVMIIKNKE